MPRRRRIDDVGDPIVLQEKLEDIADAVTRCEEGMRVDLFEAFMGVHGAMEQIGEGDLPNPETIDQLERRAHKFYDIVEQWRGVIRLRQESGL